MSLVERALKKLKEAKQTSAATPSPSSYSNQVAAASVIDRHSSARSALSDPQTIDIPPLEIRPARSGRMARIDREALRAMELLPPVSVQKQIAGQYQMIKRPLIASAMGGQNAQALPNGRTIMMTSALPGEGKTFTSINLALSMAMEKDIEVLLADADVAKPHISRIFGLEGEKGLLDLMTDSTLHPESLVVDTDVPGLTLLSSGTQTSNATELLASKRMDQVIAQLMAADPRRIILLDSPPLMLSSEARALVSHAGQIVLVVRAEMTSQKAVLDAIDVIGDARPVNLILNQSSAPPSGGYYGYGSYGDAARDQA